MKVAVGVHRIRCSVLMVRDVHGANSLCAAYNEIAMTKDLGNILEDWPQAQGTVAARVISSDTGQEFLQLRVDLGILQMDLDGRPDGQRPYGSESVLRYLLDKTREENGFQPDDRHWQDLDREIVQYYHRRIALLAVGGAAQARGDTKVAAACYRRAVRDADHNLAIMDFIRKLSDDSEHVDEHERHRSFVLLHRTLAAAQALVMQGAREAAIDTLKDGTDRIQACYRQQDKAHLAEFDSSILQIRLLERRLRREFGIDRTLREQLADAIRREDFRLAAQIRDRLNAAPADYSII